MLLCSSLAFSFFFFSSFTFISASLIYFPTTTTLFSLYFHYHLRAPRARWGDGGLGGGGVYAGAQVEKGLGGGGVEKEGELEESGGEINSEGV